MSLAFDFHPEARSEFISDVDWYDARDYGVGERFEEAVRAAIGTALDSPESWPSWLGWNRQPIVRSKSVNGFPYRVVYFIADEHLTVVAVAHSSRRPGYWRGRLPLA